MDAETSDVTDDAEMPEEADIQEQLVEAWANVLVELHANVAKTEEHRTSMEEMATCESNSHARPC